MKIGLVQLNPTIGDFKGNCQKIIDYARQAEQKGCELVIFPELAISGYPPQDLLERPSFIRDHDLALASLCSELPSIDVLIGCLERREGLNGKSLYNSAIVVRAGERVFTGRKQLLPTYDVFDETRYFEPGERTTLYRFDDNHFFGVTVCEDVWYEEIGEYDLSPVDDIHTDCAAQNISLTAMINISASPFHRDKERQRRAIFSAYCRQYATPFLYCNQVGGQDSLLFDGRSMVMDLNGETVAQAKGFTEDLIIVDSDDWQGEIHAERNPQPVATVYDALVMGVRDYTQKCGFSSAVIGLSGGIDSALTAAIAVDALGEENVLGVAMPSPYSSSESLEDARQLAQNLSCNFEIIPIEPLFSSFRQSLSPLFDGLAEDLTEQNLQARIRGNLLMSLSNKFGHILLTTGNKSEMAVGYCTLYGDMSGGLAVISDVPKQLVYELSSYVNRDGVRIPQRIIEKPPSAELKPDQLDQDDLPPYEILDEILTLYLEQAKGVTEIIASGYSEELVRDIVRRVQINEYKRKQAPLGLKVTSKAFGAGRRYPNAQKYSG